MKFMTSNNLTYMLSILKTKNDALYAPKDHNHEQYLTKKEHGTHLTLGTSSSNAFRGDYGNTAYNHSQSAHAPSNAQKNSDITKAEIEAKLIGTITTHTHNNATTSASGLMSASDKSKLNGIASGAEVNQNAFSKIAIGNTNIIADTATDTLTLVAGSNVTITPDATIDKITIAATDTVYTHPSYTAKSSGLYKITVDATGHVSGTTAVAKSDITALGIPSTNTTYGTGNASTAGLTKLYTSTGTNTDGTMTQAAIKSALDGKANSSHSHGYLPLSGGTMSGDVSYQFTGTGGHAIGLIWKNNNKDKTVFGGVGALANAGVGNTLYMGWGDSPWIASNNFNVSSSGIKYKGNKIYHAGDKPTPADIGAAAKSHGTHVSYGGNGSATTVSRSDHTHSYLPLSGGTMTGNIKFTDVTSTTYPAKSAMLTWNGSTDGADIYYQVDASDKGRLVLNTRDDADCIIMFANNGVSKATIDNSGNFSGKAAKADTLNTARTLTIGNTGKKFNGSANVSWSLSEIGAAPASHGTHLTIGTGAGNAAAGNHTHNYAGSSSAGGAATSANKVNTNLAIKLNGGTTEGTNLFTFNGSAAKTVNITPGSIGAAASSHGTHVSYGGNGSATTVSRSDHTHSHLEVKGTNTITSTTNDTTAKWGAQKTSIHWYTTSGQLTDQPSQYGYILNIGQNSEVHQLWMTQSSGDLKHRGGNASGWSGTWRTVLDSSNFKTHVTPANIGAAAGSHTHSYLPLSGGTMTGKITTPNNAQGITIGDDVTLCDRNIADHLVLEGSTATNGGITFGSGKDTNIYRGGANILKTDDTMNAVGGFQWNGQSLDNRYAASSHGTHLTIGTGESNAAAGNHTHKYAGSSSAGGTANSVNGYTIWAGTKAQYDAIKSKSSTTLYFIKEQ